MVGKISVCSIKSTSTSPTLTCLSRYPLSVVLSYLTETEGTSALITHRHFARRILPLFRLPRSMVVQEEASRETAGCNKRRVAVARHRFVVVPVQDPHVLLGRLNTRRLWKRLTWNRKKRRQRGGKTYARGMSSEQLAWLEWEQSCSWYAERCSSRNGGDDVYGQAAAEDEHRAPLLPADYGLLRFLDDDCVPSKPHPITEPLRFNATIPSIAKGVTLLASYPRSGNTLLRTLLERTTSIVTGSDTRADRTLSKSLAMQHNLVGEGVVQAKKVCVVKTHFPERRGYMPYPAHRVILLVRNPYDAIDSYWNLCLTNTHTASLHECVYSRYEDKFIGMARNEIGTWIRFHDYWLRKCRQSGVPLMIVRYEDLIMDTEREMRRVIGFMSGQNVEDDACSIHPFWVWRIRCALGRTGSQESGTGENGAPTPMTSSKGNSVGVEKSEGGSDEKAASIPTMMRKDSNISNLGSYRPRSSGGNLTSIGKSLRKNRYSDKTLIHMHDVAVSMALDAKAEDEVNAAVFSVDDAAEPMLDRRKTMLQMFGYDIFNQGFPANFVDEDGGVVHGDGASSTTHDPNATIRVNVGQEIRPPDDPYGRTMTAWRKGETEGDTKPFPVVQRS